MIRRHLLSPNDDSGNAPSVPNRIISARYTLLTFLPLNLFNQFVYYPVNMWFAVISVLQIPLNISITRGYPTMLVPLSFVLFVAALKDAVEDYRRHQNDKLENNRRSHRWSREKNELEETRWRDVKVGDTLAIFNSEFVPADVMILGTFGAGSSGRCYVETANLDGETNHKTKQAPMQCVTFFDETNRDNLMRDVDQIDGAIEFEFPNASLYSFAGTLHVQSAALSRAVPPFHVGADMSISFDAKNLLLRGCKLMNTTWIVGKVVYTGDETKIQMNLTQKVKKKMTRVEKFVLRILIAVFVLQIFLSSMGAAFNTLFISSSKGSRSTYLFLRQPNPTYLDLLDPPPLETFGLRFFTFVLIFSNFVPISLIVTMNMVKLGQAIFMHADDSMMFKGFRVTPRTSDLNEELGQVQYVLTDKTGTLTENKMEFRKCFVDGVSYGVGTTQIAREISRQRRMQRDHSGSTLSDIVPSGDMSEVQSVIPMSAQSGDISEEVTQMAMRNTPCVCFDDARLLHALRKGQNHLRIYDFFLHLVINHVAYPVTQNGDTTYSASPEEKALVFFGSHFDFRLCERTSTMLVIQVPESDEKLEVEILVAVEFNSVRRRSSTIAKFVHPITYEETLMCYTKGADVVIEQRLLNEEDASCVREISLEYALQGLRTLVFAHRTLSAEVYEEWSRLYTVATESVHDREVKMDLAAEVIEERLELDGIAAIEDKLQDGVGETISLMKEAGMKVWMLTGDKPETAISVGIATSLLEVDTEDQVIFDWNIFEKPQDPGTPRDSSGKGIGCAPSNDMSAIRRVSKLVGSKILPHVDKSKQQRAARERCIALYESCLAKAQVSGRKSVVIDGESLACLIERADDFLELCRNCSVVLCCRISPDQKGQIVRLLRDSEKAVTLAIGDGANDCNMILSANVGVGICGEEGLQAFNSCDYGIGQFSALKGLLFVHGRYAYRRISFVALYIFYKNIVVVIPQYMLGAWSQFSGMRLYPDLLYQLYNVFFTGVPIWIYGMVEKDIPRTKCFSFPTLYKLGPACYYLNFKNVLSYAFVGVWHAALVFSIPYLVLSGRTNVIPLGKTADLWCVGNVTLLLEIIIVNGTLLLDSYTIHWVSWLGYAFCFGSYAAFCLLVTFVSQMFGGGWETYGVYSVISETLIVHPVVSITLNIAFGYRLAWMIIRRMFFPTPVQKAHLTLESAKREKCTTVTD